MMEPRCRDRRGSSNLLQHGCETEIAAPCYAKGGPTRIDVIPGPFRLIPHDASRRACATLPPACLRRGRFLAILRAANAASAIPHDATHRSTRRHKSKGRHLGGSPRWSGRSNFVGAPSLSLYGRYPACYRFKIEIWASTRMRVGVAGDKAPITARREFCYERLACCLNLARAGLNAIAAMAPHRN